MSKIPLLGLNVRFVLPTKLKLVNGLLELDVSELVKLQTTFFNPSYSITFLVSKKDSTFCND